MAVARFTLAVDRRFKRENIVKKEQSWRLRVVGRLEVTPIRMETRYIQMIVLLIIASLLKARQRQNRIKKMIINLEMMIS